MTSTAAILIHGFGGDTTVWDQMDPILASDGYSVHRVELAGHNADASNLPHVEWQDWVADLSASIEQARSVAERVVVVGYSMGATLAMLALAENKVDRAVLLSPSLDVARIRKIALSGLSKVGVSAIPRGLIGSKNTDGEPPLPVSALQANLQLKDQASRRNYSATAPTMLISGSRDTVAGSSAAVEVLDRFAAGTRLVAIAGADHDLLGGEQAANVIALAREFLASAIGEQ